MPAFCRHGRVVDNCPICSKAARTRPGTVADREAARRPSGEPRAPREKAPARPRTVAAKRRAQRPGADMVVRRVARAADDGYANALVPGLRATADAARLADELALAAARLDTLRDDPPGVYGEAASADDREEGLWLLFLTALLSPAEGDEPFAAVEAARVPWSSGELAALDEAVPGPRPADPRRLLDVVAGYRARAAKAGGQAALLEGEAAWTAQRRFDRAFERLAIGGLTRAARHEFLLTAGRVGLLDAEPWTLSLGGDALDPVTVAAKRMFGIGDAVLLGRRAGELAAACGVPAGALDLALFNWSRPAERYAAGVDAPADDTTLAVARDALGVVDD